MRMPQIKLTSLATVVALFTVACGGSSDSGAISDDPERFLDLCSGAMNVYYDETSTFWNEDQIDAFENLGPDGLTDYDTAFTYSTDVSEMQGVLDGLEWSCLFVPQTAVTRWAWEDIG